MRPDVLERPFPTMLMLFHPAGGPGLANKKVVGDFWGFGIRSKVLGFVVVMCVGRSKIKNESRVSGVSSL